jgi:succinate dehydrogenase/fumarate reductase flavoprotein subunit
MKIKQETRTFISRRGFIKTAAVGASATVLAGFDAKGIAKNKTVDIGWDKEADVVVVGYGGAGIVAAITAHDEGAKVLVLEKAPSRGGGNTAMSFGQCSCPTNAKDAADYLYAGCGGLDPGGSLTPRDVIEAWAEEVCKNKEWWDKMGIEHKVMTKAWTEFTDLPGASAMIFLDPVGKGQAVFSTLDKHAKNRGIEVMFDSPATELIQDPDTKEILGVKTNSRGDEKKIKARKGVILCTGGFEFNEEMKKDFLKCYPMKFYGWKYNTGDSVKMAQMVGADLWHMDMCAGGSCAWFPEDTLDVGYAIGLRSNNYILVDRSGRRYANERDMGGHHKGWVRYSEFSLKEAGYTRIPTYMIFDETARKAGPINESFEFTGREILPAELGGYPPWSDDNMAEIEKGWIKKGDTIESLAAAIGGKVDPALLKKSLDSYNSYCSAGKDPEFGRDTRTLKPVEAPPFYAVPLYPGMVCTHGGARRNGKAQILNPYKKPIPRLYSAGSFGSVYGRIYSVTAGNIGEVCAFGRIAGRNAAAEKPWS